MVSLPGRSMDLQGPTAKKKSQARKQKRSGSIRLQTAVNARKVFAAPQVV